jgi:hypothetical protein
MHPQAEDALADLRHFKAKGDAGADSAITQYFFNADAYFRFVDDVRAMGIDAPIVPGHHADLELQPSSSASPRPAAPRSALDRQAHAGLRRRSRVDPRVTPRTWSRHVPAPVERACRSCTSTRST